jgi:hypothetical protein
MKRKTSDLKAHRRASAHGETRYISNLIQEATQAPLQDVAMIEHIMRGDIFHSTLDWQTRHQLVDGARAAHSLLVTNRELFEFEQKAAAAFCAELATSAQTSQASPEAKGIRLK